MGASARINKTLPHVSRPAVAVRPAYDLGEPEKRAEPFDWAGVDMDILSACTTQVLCAGDMVSYTMDRGGNSVLVTVLSDGAPLKKWCNTSDELNKHLTRIFDGAIARQNVSKPPKLPGMA